MPKLLRVVLLSVFFVSGCDLLDPDSDNAYLIDLEIAGVQLTPAFDPNIASYTATVDSATEEVLIEVAAANIKASVVINGTSSGTSTATVAVQLSPGENTLLISVTAENGDDQRTYTVVIKRPAQASYTIGGTVSGLTGTLILLNNGGSALTLTENGAFVFDAPVENGATYNVTVGTQPSGQACSIENGTGAVAAADIANVNVSCVTPAYTVGGTVSGLSGSVTLQNNGGNDLTVTENGSFEFDAGLAGGADYDVKVSAQPTGQSCAVSNGAGTIGTADVTNISVTCVVPTYTIGGTVSGLSGSVTLQNNGGDDLTVSQNGSFAFATGLVSGSAYNVTVSAQPAGQSCTVTNGAGTVGTSDVTGISVGCVALTYSIGGTLSGLSGSVTLQNNGGDDLALTENGAFAFATSLGNGAAYNVTVSVQPAGQSCTVTNGAGTVGTSDVTGISVDCIALSYSIGGTLSGLSGSVTLQNNGGDDLALTENGAFAFATSIENGAAYNVTVSVQPAGQSCSVTNGFGAVNAADVTNVDVSCADTGGGASSGWSWANPLPQGNNIEDIIWTGSQFVAVGAYGTILTSPDGLGWTARDSGTEAFLEGVAWDGSKLVAVGTGATVLSSPDGIIWTSIDLGLITNLNKIIWNGSQFVAVGSGMNSQVVTSPDGVNWTARNAATSYVNLYDVAWNGSQFAAVALGSGIYNYVYTSPNGISWTRQYLGPNNTGYSITTDGNQFVVAASRYVYASTDGVTWELRLSSNDNPYGVYASLWDGNQFVLAASNAILTSPDGITWTATAGLSLGSVLSIATNGSQYLVGGRAGMMSNTPDLAAWTAQTTGPANHLTDLVWTGELFVAVGHSVIMTSPDGVAWTQRDQNTLPSDWPNSASLSGVAWSGSGFVSVGFSGDLLTSPDGLTWAQGNSGVTASLNDIVWDGAQYVVVGSANTVLTSPDGTTWTQRSSSAVEGTNLLIIGWNGTQFVAVGTVTGGNLALMTSPDGITWANQSISGPQYTTPEEIIWDGSQWLMATSRGMFTSPGGAVWTAQTIGSPDNQAFYSVVYTGQQYYIATGGTEVLMSVDGVTWSSQNALTGSMQRLVWDGSKLVTVGYQGSILNYTDR